MTDFFILYARTKHSAVCSAFCYSLFYKSRTDIITICPWRCQHFIFVNDYCIHFNTFKYTVYQGLCCFPQADQVGRPRQQQISLHIPHPSETSVLYEASFQPVTRTENHLNDAWFPINMFCFEYLKYLYWDTYKK